MRDKNQKIHCDLTFSINLFTPSSSPLLINLFAYNSHPGYLPSQILRFWDGAYTGYNGQRHGLKYFLSAAKETNTPIALLDINSPSGLAALEFLGVTKDIIDLQKASIVFLPTTVNLSGPISQLTQEFSLQSAINHNYLNQNLIYCNSHQQNFLNIQDHTFSYKKNNSIFIPIERGVSDPFTKSGFSDDSIKNLYNNIFLQNDLSR